MPAAPYRLKRYALVFSGWVVAAVLATSASSPQPGSLSAPDIQEFAQAYAGLADGTADTAQYESTVSSIATRLESTQAQEFTECATVLAEAVDSSKFTALKDAFASAMGPTSQDTSGGERNDASRRTLDNLAQGNVDAARCGEVLGIELVP